MGDGSQLLVFFAGVLGLYAAVQWWRVAMSIRGEAAKPEHERWRRLNDAAVFTAGALGFASVAAVLPQIV